MNRTGKKRPLELRTGKGRLIRDSGTGLIVTKSRKIDSKTVRQAYEGSCNTDIPPTELKKVADLLDRQTANSDVKLSWFFGKQAHLDGKSPLELLEAGEVKRVLTAARNFMKDLNSNSLYVSRKEHERTLKMVIRHWRNKYVKLERNTEGLQTRLKRHSLKTVCRADAGKSKSENASNLTNQAGVLSGLITVVPCGLDLVYARMLARQATLRHVEPTSLSGTYFKEKIIEEEFSGIGFRDAFGGREAYVRGHQMAVWEVVALYDKAKTVMKTAERLGWPSVLVQGALKYAQAFPKDVAYQRKAAKPHHNDLLIKFRLKVAHERGQSVRRMLMQSEGGSLSAAEVAHKIGISEAAVMKRSRNGNLIAWRAESTSPVRFPVWQFRGHQVLNGIKETQRVLDDDDLINDWGRMLFFLSHLTLLGGKRPLDCLRTGEIAKVLRAAQQLVQ